MLIFSVALCIMFRKYTTILEAKGDIPGTETT